MKYSKIERDGRLPNTPVYQTEGAAAMDLCAFLPAPITIPAMGGRALIPTGLKLSVPLGMAALILCRSSMGAKHGICLSNGVGLIDSDYRGEIFVALLNTSDAPFVVSDGDRIAQLMLINAPPFTLEEGELSKTIRGDGGFGSTGV